MPSLTFLIFWTNFLIVNDCLDKKAGNILLFGYRLPLTLLSFRNFKYNHVSVVICLKLIVHLILLMRYDLPLSARCHGYRVYPWWSRGLIPDTTSYMALVRGKDRSWGLHWPSILVWSSGPHPAAELSCRPLQD